MRRAARARGPAVTPAALRRLAGAGRGAQGAGPGAAGGAAARRTGGSGRRSPALAGTAARDLAEGAALPLAQQGLRQAWADRGIAGGPAAAGASSSPRIRAARAEAVQSLGKHEALEALVERADRAAAQLRIARAEREGPVPAGKGFDAAG